ncbi:MAG: TIGR00725 family protein [Methanomicrobiales archaeon]|nr:TIGR00725 family protein [Methanomicrobiales archaeon]MDI6876123.1 TIGR00725 family protein [Methanomicrobiales archaeon]
MQIAVIGPEPCSEEEYAAARIVGGLIADHRGTLCCGGLGGVMEAACRGAKERDGTTVGILPHTGAGNPYLDIAIRTGLGHARNAVLVQSADAVVAIGGGYGTLSEIAIALKCGRPLSGYRTWAIEGVIRCGTPEEAALTAVRAARRSR